MDKRAKRLLVFAAVALTAYASAVVSAGAAFAVFLALGIAAELRFWLEVLRALRGRA